MLNLKRFFKFVLVYKLSNCLGSYCIVTKIGTIDDYAIDTYIFMAVAL